MEKNGYVVLEKQSEGTYFGKASLKWRVESDVYTFFIPQPKYHPYTIKVGPSIEELPIIHILPISTTFNWKFNETTIRFTVMLIGFSFLMLQPILNSILGLNED